MKTHLRHIQLTILLTSLLTPLLPGHAATVLPVGPLTFSTNADYDSNFKESASNTGNTRNIGGFVQLQGFQFGPAVYDTSATGGLNGSGGTGGSDANNDLSNFTISADVATTEVGSFGAGFLLRLNASESNGYFASFSAVGAQTVQFRLGETAGLVAGEGSSIYSQNVNLTGLTLAVNQFYPFKVTAVGGTFGFDFGSGAATASFTDTTVSATTGQVGFSLTTAGPSAATRLDNFAIVPEPSAALLLLLGVAGCSMRRRSRHPDMKTSSQWPSGLKTKSLILALSFSAALHPASAQTLYSTGFENPPFANGSTLLGQDGWSTAIPPFLNPNAAIITNAAAASGLQSVQVRGVDLVTAPEVAPYAAVGSYRRPLNYDASTGNPIVRIQSDVRLDGPLLGTGDFFTANIAARTGDGFAGELSLSSDGFVYGYTGTGSDPAPLFSTPVTLNAWHTLGITVNFAANTYTFSVDGTSSSAFAFDPAFVSDVLVRESLVVYARPDAGTNLRSAFVARYDNVSATAVPEPGSALLLAFGSLALAGVRRRSRRE